MRPPRPARSGRTPGPLRPRCRGGAEPRARHPLLLGGGVLVGDPAGVDGTHVHALLGKFGGAGAREHVEGGLGHVGVRMARRLVPYGEAALDGGHVDDISTRVGRGEQQGQQPVAEQCRGERVDQLGLQDLGRVEFTQPRRPGVLRGGIGQQPGLVGLPQRRGERRGTTRQRPHRREPRRLPSPFGQPGALPTGQQRVRLGGSPHRLRGVVDQDVEGLTLLPQLLADPQYLTRITEVHRQHRQPVQPLRAARFDAEATHGVVREAAGDQEFGAVAQHHQGQLEADLDPASGEQRATAAQVGGERTPGGVVRGAVRAQPVVEGVDLSIGRLADIAGTGLHEDAAAPGTVERCILPPVERSRRGRGHHGRVGGGEFGAAHLAPAHPPVPREGRGDLFGAQPHRVVDGQRPQLADRTMECRQFVLRDRAAVTHVSPPRVCAAVVLTGFEPAYPP